MPTATLTSKGQVTIPKKIRDKLGLKPGDKIDFDLQTEDEVKITTVKYSILERAGSLKAPQKRPATLEEMDDAIKKGITERYERSRY